MQAPVWLAYTAYFTWIISGWADFRCHRNTDIAHTSGLAESKSHLWELGILAVAVFAFLLWETNAALVILLSIFVIGHAVAGYIDSSIAFNKSRTVTPWEQLVHSVLNTAPWVALVWIVVAAWPSVSQGTYHLQLRSQPFSIGLWLVVVGPPAVLNTLPAITEYRACKLALSDASYTSCF